MGGGGGGGVVKNQDLGMRTALNFKTTYTCISFRFENLKKDF